MCAPSARSPSSSLSSFLSSSYSSPPESHVLQTLAPILTCLRTQLGYAASASSGWRSSGRPLDRWDIGNLTQLYLGNLTAVALEGGVPSSKVRDGHTGTYTHTYTHTHTPTHTLSATECVRATVALSHSACLPTQLYTHSGGTSLSGTTDNIPFEAAFAPGATPGWSVYKCVWARCMLHR